MEPHRVETTCVTQVARLLLDPATEAPPMQKARLAIFLVLSSLTTVGATAHAAETGVRSKAYSTNAGMLAKLRGNRFHVRGAKHSVGVEQTSRGSRPAARGKSPVVESVARSRGKSVVATPTR
jgi:hypothetical protein